MQTLGQMEVDPQQLVASVRDAIAISKKTTALVRSAWEQRFSLPLLQMELQPFKPKQRVGAA